jgi:hypothetical protein
MRRMNSLLGAGFRGWGSVGSFTKIFLCILVVIVGTGPTLAVLSVPYVDWFTREKDQKAPVDYGYGPGLPIGSPRPNLRLGQTPVIPKSGNAAQPKSGIAAQTPIASGGGAGGFFGPVFPWPIIPIHVALLPDGRVLSFGTDQNGNQGAQMLYDVWDPTQGNGSNAHNILQNTTSTDIFCAGVSLLAGSGNVLITGGDLTMNGVRNYSNTKVNIFSPTQNTLTASGQMTYPRWYDSITTLPNTNKLVLGGTVSPNVGEPTPEVFSATNGWSTLPLSLSSPLNLC